MAFFNMIHTLVLMLVFAPLAILSLPTISIDTDLTQLPSIPDNYFNGTFNLDSSDGTSKRDQGDRWMPDLALGPGYRIKCIPLDFTTKPCILRSFQEFDGYTDFTWFDRYCNRYGFKTGRVGEHVSMGASPFRWTVEIDWDNWMHIWAEWFVFKYAGWSSGDGEDYQCLSRLGDRPFKTCLAGFDCTA